MDFLNQEKVESSFCEGNGKKQKNFKKLEKKFHELRTLCDVRASMYVNSEFNKDKNGDGLVRILPENPNECQEIVDDCINYDPKTAAGKRKRDTDEEAVDSDQCVNDNKMRRLCNVDVKEENQQVQIIDQELGDLSVEEIERNLDAMFGMISENKSMAKGCNEDDMLMTPLPLSSSMDSFNYNQDEWLNLPGLSNTTTTDDDEFDLSVEEIERNLEPKFGMISEKLDQLMMEKNKSMAKGCNEDDMVMMNEFPPLPLLSSLDFFNYNKFDQEDWLNLPALTTTTNDAIGLAPFPAVIDFQPLHYYYAGLIY